ncbi:MAG: bifunctional diaminohydroxyphosphoribosylaminopyrimidine deaminase/5-amino-6-(5-phosphoribosylamino)uracil reductase RibD [Planctomycetes bacterium]|nr:bifunctional diaminohydroxyphosphoribosylaminopyrimidine deaminase/5-amino-6-(5-phosphoribosylamino)uracil reductase RibD [Planctomycetota bacterium]
MPPWDEREKCFMRRALALAGRGRGRVEPNPMVGAVVVRGGRIIGEGYHRQFGGPHAEVHALAGAGASACGAALYVTLEPCDHHGKTPPCTEAIVAAGVHRVVAAMQDPDERVSGRGVRRLRRAGLDVEMGLCREEARALNAPYLKLKTRHVPYVTAKWAMTLDGRIASLAHEARWITSEAARRHGHRARSLSDAILVGIGTVLADDPLLTCRIPGGRHPTRIVLDSRGRLPLRSRLVRTARESPVLVVTTAAAPAQRLLALERAGCRVCIVPVRSGRCSLPDLLGLLGREQATHLLVEGGQQVLSSFFRAHLVDRVLVYLGPKILGDGLSPIAGLGCRTVAEAMLLEPVSLRRLGPDLVLEARRLGG